MKGDVRVGMALMRAIRRAFILLLCAMIVLPGVFGANTTTDKDSTPSLQGFFDIREPRPLKVVMGARTLWGDGGYTYEQMAAAAANSGANAFFSADNPLLYGSVGTLADPNFQDVTPYGNFSKWTTGFVPIRNSLTACDASVGVFTLRPPTYYLGNNSQVTAFQARQRVLSGTHSLHISLQCPSPTLSGYGRQGIAFVRDMFPDGYLFNNSDAPPSHPLLINDLNFSLYVYLESMGYAYTPEGQRGGQYSYKDSGWFYVRFTLGAAQVPGPLSGLKLTITLVYSDHAADAWLKKIRSALNQTTYKVIYLGIPPLGTWVNMGANVTGLAASLWNQTIADYWRLNQIEIGAFSRNGALVDAYVDDVSLKALNSRNPLQYFDAAIQNQVSTSNFKAYAGYTIGQPNLPNAFVYGTNYLDLNRQYNLTNPEDWETLSAAVLSHGGTIMIGPVSSNSLGDYIAATDAFGIRIIDASAWPGMTAAAQVMQNRASPVVFTATKKMLKPTDVNSTKSWSIRVYAENNSEQAILGAIGQGRDYLALNGFNGTFAVSAYGLPLTGTQPIYIPTTDNASLSIAFNGISPGLLRVFQGATIAVKAPQSGSLNSTMTFRMVEPTSRFFVGVSGVNDTLTALSNPMTFVQTSIIPGTAAFIDEDNWTLQSSQWTVQGQQQRLRFVVVGPTGTNAVLYFFSPSYRPDAKSRTEIARSITVDNMTMDPALYYSVANSMFIIPLQSTGTPIEVTLNFDISGNAYLIGQISSLVGLYLLALVPIAVTALYSALKRGGRVRAKRTKE